ncbi:MAG: formylglycine-generating enzyme family protein [Muribaculaceae bacterium]|nr:formylglycine-generating enzyme family protein [Muribaculaceae bacterium]
MNKTTINMRNFNKITFGVLFSVCMSMFASCTSQDDIINDFEKKDNPNLPHSCELLLNVTRAGFDDEPATRADDEWTDGDKIYLTFSTDNGDTYGDATYTSGAWTVNYYGSLTEGTTSKCTAVYFDNPDFESGSVVQITENTGIYEDQNGSYIFNGGSLSVVAELKPKTGRIRFAGTDNDAITVCGISHYTSYDCTTGKFSNFAGAVKTTVKAGYTPYIYGEFADMTQPRLNIITANSAYSRGVSTSIYKAGESGYMTIPTETSHTGWMNAAVLKVNGVEFTMIPVAYENGNFLLAETETTEELYDAVISNGESSSQLPKNNTEWKTYITKLSALTGLEFRIPTLEEWQFAYRGGNKSKGYAYSGSNVISDVAWYKDNSDGTRHDVKQLQPNELGFYDMSGNVSEYVTAGSAYGGYWQSNESECSSTSSIHPTYQERIGCRVALSNQ